MRQTVEDFRLFIFSSFGLYVNAFFYPGTSPPDYPQQIFLGGSYTHCFDQASSGSITGPTPAFIPPSWNVAWCENVFCCIVNSFIRMLAAWGVGYG
jgi:hypothetical protein